MTNRDKINALSNREMAVLWDYIKSDCAGSNCVFYACPDCGGDCLKGFEAWLGLECEVEENPPAENVAEPQQEAPAERNHDKTIEDLRKAVWYINRQIQRLEGAGK
ncbi:hypothetical protein FYJ84_04450 [Veillonellaceae bacterium WCA-693-APC-5D-A]|uniref:Uncharacterized protein n=1 Tax=Anaerovibrio slackiae TaxID=2652309 RepID=A0A6I2UEZ0_9FIRM|nr:hypothetical protein [Anaerovibrio slackiae]MSU08239.1 hypothetical protein [Anaerovibrio slackiae]